MTENTIKDQWKPLRTKLKARWVKLTAEGLKASPGGSPDCLAGKLQEHYVAAPRERRRYRRGTLHRGVRVLRGRWQASATGEASRP